MTSEGGGIDDALIGGNASAEGGAEALDEVTQKGCNIVLAHKLQSVAGLSKKEYQLNVKVRTEVMLQLYKSVCDIEIYW